LSSKRTLFYRHIDLVNNVLDREVRALGVACTSRGALRARDAVARPIGDMPVTRAIGLSGSLRVSV
jgi:hypothetical protein